MIPCGMSVGGTTLIDLATHANDRAGIVGDINAFDKAVSVAMDFARRTGARSC